MKAKCKLNTIKSQWPCTRSNIGEQEWHAFIVRAWKTTYEYVNVMNTKDRCGLK